MTTVCLSILKYEHCNCMNDRVCCENLTQTYHYINKISVIIESTMFAIEVFQVCLLINIVNSKQSHVCFKNKIWITHICRGFGRFDNSL